MARSVDKIVVVDGHAMRMGTWNAAEHRLFLEGLEKFGKDFKLLEKYIGSRTQSQVRTHYQQYAKKNDLASPEPTRKRKSEDVSSVTPKKTKNASSPSKPKSTTKSSIYNASRVTPKPSSKKATPSPKKERSVGKDLIPPSAKSAVKSTRKKSPAPRKLDPVTKESAAVMEYDASSEPEIIRILKREEVQTVIAGIVGFVLVFAIKKYIG
jgi:SHAQKYF class myb-like DNA-binding protein